MTDHQSIYRYNNPEVDIYRIPDKRVVVAEIGNDLLMFTAQRAQQIAVKLMIEALKLAVE